MLSPSSKASTILKALTTNGGLFITAWNPLGKEVAIKDNEEANKKLKAELLKRDSTVIDGYGESIDSACFFAYPIDEETSLKLCCDFHQNAVVYVSSDGIPALLLNPELS